ncbi:MAG: tripartite tricarboxylate transporter permease, partial [Candidatus Competibacteraceae bacterium]|nr:tripartite tricarboxylate transporter permease [Candidatus Competibacteraceae bacterium]
IMAIPYSIMVPIIAAVSFVGVYGIHSGTFDLILMVVLGVIGYILRKMDFPTAPIILGFVLAELMEQNLRRALAITNGDVGILFESPISITLWILSALVLILPIVLRFRARRRQAKAISDSPQP